MESTAVIGTAWETDMKRLQIRNSKALLFVFLGALLLMATSATQAEGEGIPARMFEAGGIMQYVDLASGIVLIDKKRYRLAQNMKWYGLNSETSINAQLLRAANQKVAYVVDPSSSKPMIKAIWILPSEGR